MIQFPEYIFKSLLCGLAFWGLYKLFGEKLLSYDYQRRYIVFSSFFTLVFPFIRIPVLNNLLTRGENIFSLDIPALIFRGNATGEESLFSIEKMLNSETGFILPLFLAISLLYLLYTIAQIAFLFLLHKKGEVSQLNDLEVIINAKVKSPFSFFRWIFLKPGMNENEIKQVICHESSHIKRKHSLDVLAMSAIKTFQWFNPFVFLLGKSLSSLHEYQADRDVLREGYRLEDYQQLILSLQFGISPLLANRLNNSLTIKRLLQMKKSVTKQNSVAGMILLSAGTLILLFFISVTGNSQARSVVTKLATGTEMSVQIADSFSDTVKQEKEIPFMVVEKKPKFNGGDENIFVQWIYNQLKYPKEAKDKGIQGKITISFVVKKDGSVSDVKVLRGVNELLDKEAVRVISSSPKWTPGVEKGEIVNVRYNFPIIFKLQ